MISKKVISFFTFGVFLIIGGSILKISEKPQASLILAIGLTFQLVALLIFIWNKLKK